MLEPVLPTEPGAIDASHRLVVYGTLAPGGANHHVVEHLPGTWEPAVLRGDLEWLTVEIPRLRWRDDGDEVPAQLLTSVALPHAWPQLDAFEGEAYVRTVVPAHTERGPVAASCYVHPAGLTAPPRHHPEGRW